MTENDRLQRIHESTATPLDTKVGLGLHPDAIVAHGQLLCDASGPGEVAYTSGRTALHALYSGLSTIEAANHEMSVDKIVGRATQRVVPPERAPQLAAAMDVKFKNVARTLERNEAAVDEAITQLESRVQAAILHPRKDTSSGVQFAAEIRSHLRDTLKTPSERLDFIRKAIAEGDLEIASAVLSTTSYNSGLSKQEQSLVRGLAEERFALRESKQRDAAMKIKATLQTAMQQFVGRYVQLLPKIQEAKGAKALERLRA